MAKERPPLEEMTLRQLRRVASEYKVSRYSRMRKAQLLTSINEAMSSTRQEDFYQDSSIIQEEQLVKATKFEVGQEDNKREILASVDQDLGELPDGYGDSRIVLMPRDPQWAYAYWDIPNAHKEELRRQGGQQLALRIYDVTDIDINSQAPHSVQEYLCDEMAREWYLPIPVSDRDYVADIGYRCADGRWLTLARSTSVSIPPVYPSDWVDDVFVSVGWQDDLKDKTVYTLMSPGEKQALGAVATNGDRSYGAAFAKAQSMESMAIAGSIFGSMHQAPESALSSYVFPSGAGMWGNASGQNMSGAGFSGDLAAARPRQFWLVADAELIVYGATEPNATVTIGDRQIKLNADGTFRFQMSFQDGMINYPIKAVAVDGEQTRSIHMDFERQTHSRNTNTKAEAVEEWFA